MRAEAIGRVFDKLNAMQRAAAAIEALDTQSNMELPAELPDLPEEAAGESPGRPEDVPVAHPEHPATPEEDIAGPGGRPEPVPAARPEHLKAAVAFCAETGLPTVAMADSRDLEEDEDPEDADF